MRRGHLHGISVTVTVWSQLGSKFGLVLVLVVGVGVTSYRVVAFFGMDSPPRGEVDITRNLFVAWSDECS